MFCPQCGCRLDEGASFCPACGSTVLDRPSTAPSGEAGHVDIPDASRPAERSGNAVAVILTSIILGALVIYLLCTPVMTSPFITGLKDNSSSVNDTLGTVADLIGYVYQAPDISEVEDTYTMFNLGDAMGKLSSDISSVASNLGVSDTDEVQGLMDAIATAKTAQRVFFILWIVCIALIGIGMIVQIVRRGRGIAFSIVAYSLTLLTTLAWCVGLYLVNSTITQRLTDYVSSASTTLGSLGYSQVADTLETAISTTVYIDTPWFGVRAACIVCAIAIIALALLGAVTAHASRKRSGV